MQINYEPKGFNELRNALRAYPDIARPHIRTAFQDLGKILLQRKILTTKAAVPQKTGRLREAIKYLHADTWGLLFVDTRMAPYASFVHEGTRPHLITPRVKHALAFDWIRRRYVTTRTGRRRHEKKDFGRMVVKSVKHPGTKSRPFMEIIGELARPEIETRFQRANEFIAFEIARRVQAA